MNFNVGCALPEPFIANLAGKIGLEPIYSLLTVKPITNYSICQFILTKLEKFILSAPITPLKIFLSLRKIRTFTLFLLKKNVNLSSIQNNFIVQQLFSFDFILNSLVFFRCKPFRHLNYCGIEGTWTLKIFFLREACMPNFQHNPINIIA